MQTTEVLKAILKTMQVSEGKRKCVYRSCKPKFKSALQQVGNTRRIIVVASFWHYNEVIICPHPVYDRTVEGEKLVLTYLALTDLFLCLHVHNMHRTCNKLCMGFFIYLFSEEHLVI